MSSNSLQCLLQLAWHARLVVRLRRVNVIPIYGAVAPHVVLPFVVEHAGALGKDADKFFHAIVKKVRNELNASEEAESSWSSRGFSNFYYQRISVANLKGLGHFFLVAEALLRSAGNVPFGS